MYVKVTDRRVFQSAFSCHNLHNIDISQLDNVMTQTGTLQEGPSTQADNNIDIRFGNQWF